MIARGTLGYAVAFAAERPVTIELGEQFELRIYTEDGDKDRFVTLGSPDRDWTELAVTDDRAYAAGERGEVAVIDVATGRDAARWPVGAPVTALAASEDFVAIGDAEGVLCLRDATDGALLQCVTAHDAAIASLAIADDVLTSRADDGARGWTLPGLAAATPGEEAPPPEVDLTMSGPIQGIAESPSGKIAIAAWITSLDQASVVIVTPAGVRMAP